MSKLEAINALYTKFNLRPVQTDNPDLIEFHQKATEIISEETKAAADAVRAVPPEIRDEVRRARVAGILQLGAAAVSRRLEDAAAPLLEKVGEAQRLLSAAMDRCPKDPWDRGYWYARVCEARRQLEAMDRADRPQAIKKLAEDGSDVFPEAVLNAFTPILPPGLTESFVPVYQKAVAPEALRVISEASADVEEIRSMITASRVAMVTAGGAFVPDAWRIMEKTPVPEIVKAWPAPTKTAFLAQRGEAAYAKLLTGKVELGTVLDFFRPGLK